MALFEVPGWTVPSAPISKPVPHARKRKRPSGHDDGDDDKIHSAQVNVEKLMRQLAAAEGAPPEGPKKKKIKAVEGRSRGKAQEAERTEKGAAQQHGRGKGKAVSPTTLVVKDHASPANARKQAKKNKKGAESHEQDLASAVSNEHAEEGQSRPRKKKNQSEPTKSDDTRLAAVTTTVAKAGVDSQPKDGLTTLQAGMKKSLDGARFRWINEELYKSDSAHAVEMMRANPAVFEEYHTGFRHQVQSWPTNPVAHYISVLSSYPQKTVIADLGCGDAALARALVPKDMTVLSFDLMSDDAYVIAADTCTRVPLPGAEPGEGEGEGEGQVVDVVVCALSLMGTNWPGCIREAWRILRRGGELKIAEVASRFTDVDKFISLVSSFGFHLKSKDDRNTHFTLFEFKKVACKPKNEKEWAKMLACGTLLKPCEYKRR